MHSFSNRWIKCTYNDSKKITNDFKVYIYQSFWDKILNVITYHGTYNFGDKKKQQKTHTKSNTKYMTRLNAQQLVDIN